MCADLLTVRWTEDDGRGRCELVTLEDISTAGACLHLEHSIPPDTHVSLHYPNGEYPGKVKYCVSQPIGYLIGVEFDERYRWSKADFEPSHLLELQV